MPVSFAHLLVEISATMKIINLCLLVNIPGQIVGKDQSGHLWNNSLVGQHQMLWQNCLCLSA